jgi:hypothetical protein
MQFDSRLEFNVTTKDFLKKRNLALGGQVQTYIDLECLRLMRPYVPYYTGQLWRSGLANTRPGTGLIKFKTKYARKVYYTRRKYNPDVHPLATAYWFETMATVYKNKILEGAKERAGAK